MISECAEFDKRYFPGLKHTPLTPQPFEPPPDVPFHPVADLGGEEEPNTNPIQENHAPLQAHQENISVLVCYFISFIVLLGSVK